jgi:hypothetical protein
MVRVERSIAKLIFRVRLLSSPPDTTEHRHPNRPSLAHTPATTLRRPYPAAIRPPPRDVDRIGGGWAQRSYRSSATGHPTLTVDATSGITSRRSSPLPLHLTITRGPQRKAPIAAAEPSLEFSRICVVCAFSILHFFWLILFLHHRGS